MVGVRNEVEQPVLDLTDFKTSMTTIADEVNTAIGDVTLVQDQLAGMKSADKGMTDAVMQQASRLNQSMVGLRDLYAKLVAAGKVGAAGPAANAAAASANASTVETDKAQGPGEKGTMGGQRPSYTMPPPAPDQPMPPPTTTANPGAHSEGTRAKK
jgi:prophage DNA circulation protein